MSDDGANPRACPSPHGPLSPDEFAQRYEAAAVDVARALVEIGRRRIDQFLGRAESPIELALGQQFVLLFCNSTILDNWYVDQRADFDKVYLGAIARGRRHLSWCGRPDVLITLAAQVHLPSLSWRVDFVLVACSSCVPDKPLAIIIECDGHAFHERTPDQAKRDRSRDRAAQVAGFTVFRFTGREIRRDIAGCARQVDTFICEFAHRHRDAWEAARGAGKAADA